MSSRQDPATHNPRRSWRTPLIVLVVAGLISGTLLWLGPTIASTLRVQDGRFFGGSECSIHTQDGTIELNRDQAKRATTAAALTARGTKLPDTPDVDPDVVGRLATGPPDDAGPSLHCEGTADGDLPAQELTPTGLTPRAQHLRHEMTEVFGEQPLGGFAPGGVSQGHGAESTHYDGRGIDIFFRPITEKNRRDGWIVAQWLVAHADDLDVQYVIFDDQIWSAHSSRGNWQTYNAPAPANDILRHRDHVHVDVLRGGSR